MESLIFLSGTGSIPAQNHPIMAASPRRPIRLPVQEYHAEKNATVSSPGRTSTHINMHRRKIRRSFSEPSLTGIHLRHDTSGESESRSFTEQTLPPDDGSVADKGDPPSSSSPGGGNRNFRAYYSELVKANPENSLVLRNYGNYLHEVEKDAGRAEEWYGRAILASPGDGEVLSLYGKLIWETQRDELRARHYFHQAIQASPHDCMVLGSYARFLWEAGEGDEPEEEMRENVQL
ncbi:uncharacterized protein LOC127261145 [Andrographis paniculata]|uniref:uncharacterized protein LOC127261145 n=1 Tax=Andrographis paniculata TaxID=175694 RepID=UPI0021E96934|nr:uncharacterized protein LOC127261145 [Andrographis paniculata]